MADGTVTEIQPHERALLILVKKAALDEAATRELADDVLTAAAQRPGVPIVLDLSRVRFAPSVALGVLVQLSRSFKLDGRRIALIGVEERVLGAIRITQLHRALEIGDTLEQVVDGASRPL